MIETAAFPDKDEIDTAPWDALDEATVERGARAVAAVHVPRDVQDKDAWIDGNWRHFRRDAEVAIWSFILPDRYTILIPPAAVRASVSGDQ